jgi:hypothetical protein
MSSTDPEAVLRQLMMLDESTLKTLVSPEILAKIQELKGGKPAVEKVTDVCEVYLWYCLTVLFCRWS